jgi:anti-anti-sigma factor
MTLKLLTNDGDIVRFEALGKITRDGWTQQKDPLASLFGDGIYKHKCMLSLRGALYIDSTGVEWLLNAHQRFSKEGGLLILHSPNPASKQLLKVMRMDLVLHLADDEEQALQLATKQGIANVQQS